MNQKFSGDVGQVAGGDVKSNSAQTNVNVHFHGGESKPVVTKFISDKQRNAIARKAFEIQAKTGTDKLMVYRRLMSVFDFERMDEMPRHVYERAIKYLDGWIRRGTLGQTPETPAQPQVTAPVLTAAPSTVRNEFLAEQPSPSIVAAPLEPTPAAEPVPVTASAPVQQERKRLPWVAAVLIAAAVMVAAALYVVASRRDVPAQFQAVELPQHCEYGGNRYSPGGVVMQAGIRQQCVTDGVRGARWERAPGGRH
ncbi:alpha/beta hydrolase [Burkholderia pyrrocinia]|uniref:alpha/beta hydrolase n=1 Tax=Burkholderia sp. BCC1047 TaxID=2676299 RepID=UPI00158E151A|nr:alpha/beta hydrolase [Burkholderia sp. BCC1047]EKS9886521.1 alpha/beta hydrolase [Burkholderia pyrrocinia]EKS9895486.1 alpha/beta hydrolase [Burkholderia pyrrocinia]EKS9908035.1 alpha/beta hydrolase [Burkholderia pyrrocinia]